MIRVRFAPSPTGYLHVGGARTALFNYLLARRHGGVFVLRIEDTDVERSSDEMVDGILDGLRWLGLSWHEGPLVGGPHAPYFQSQRLDIYRRMAANLVTHGAAYYCFCTPEVLKAKRESAESSGGAWKYDRTCCHLAASEIAARRDAGEPAAVRFLVPEGTTRFVDLVHGEIAFDNSTIDDFVILRSDGQPTYHLSVVSDDVEMKMTHVIRGDDHISNTPKQVLLYQAVGAPVPAFAHVPLILGQDKKRLSKRHGATSVMEYARQGYVPEAMVNFLALLGWSPGAGDRELFTLDELVEHFAVEGISGGNAVFNAEKLDWFNQQYIMRLSADDLLQRVRPVFEAAGLWSDALAGDRSSWFVSVLDLLKPRSRRLDEFAAQAVYFFGDDVQRDAAAVAKHLQVPSMREWLTKTADACEALESFDVAALEATVRGIADAHGVKAGTLIHGVRVAVTGRTTTPGLFEVLVLVGRERTVRRLRDAARRLD